MEQENRPSEPEPLVGEVVRQSPAGVRVFTNAPAASTFARRHSATRLLVAVNVIVFLVMLLKGASLMSPTPAQLLRFGALWGPALVHGQIWRMVTNAFVHIGLIHILFNMWCLWYLGELAENIFGQWTTVAIYVLTAITSSILSVAWKPMVISAGASGAIFGLAGAIIIALRVGEHGIAQPVRRAISNSAFKFALYNLIFGWLVPSIDNAGHLGGLVGGLVLGAAFGVTNSMPTQRNRPLDRAAISAAFFILLASITYWLLAPHNGHRFLNL